MVLTFLLDWPLAIGALIAALAAAFLIGFISEPSAVKEDTAIGIVFAGAFALGVALLSTLSTYAVDLTHILFGDVLAVSPADLLVMGGLGLFVLTVVALFYKEFLVLTFDPMQALVLRLPTTFLRYLLLGLIALTVVAALQTVGISLMLAMMVTPVATAWLLTWRAAGDYGGGSGGGGLLQRDGAVHQLRDVASGPTMVLVATAVFAAVFLHRPEPAVSSGAGCPAGTPFRMNHPQNIDFHKNANDEPLWTDTYVYVEPIAARRAAAASSWFLAGFPRST